MADTNFLKNLQLFPKDIINSEMVDFLIPYFHYPQYTFEAAKVACGNVAGLISWTIAMASFYEVNKEVLPLKVIFFLLHIFPKIILLKIKPGKSGKRTSKIR